MEYHNNSEWGRQYNQRAYFDLYVDNLQWGIKLIRQGGGKRLEDHVGCLCSFDRRYRNIPVQEYTLLSISPTKSPLSNDATHDMYDHVWYLVYNETHTEVTVDRKYKPPAKWLVIAWKS